MKKNISLTDLESAQQIRDQIPSGLSDPWIPSVKIPAYKKLQDIYFNHYDPVNRALEKVHFVHKKTMNSGRNEFEVVSHLWQHEKPQGSLILLHGYLEHLNLYQHLTQHGLKNHLSVAGFDLPGHGLSSGRRASIQSFDEYGKLFETWIDEVQESLKERLPKPWFLLGQSTGGAIATEHLIRNKQSIFKEVFFLAPLVRPVKYQKISWLYYFANRFVKQITRDFPANTKDLNFLKLIKDNDPLQCRYLDAAWIGAMLEYVVRLEKNLLPTATSSDNALKDKTRVHIFQGTHDVTVDGIYNIGVLEQIFEVKKLMLEGAGHYLANEAIDYRKTYLKVISEAIQKHIQAS